jgi:hypothetical protein
MTVFWDVAPCSLAEIDQSFRGVYCLHHQGDESSLMMEAISTSEMSVNVYQTTRRNIPDDSHLHTCRENLKSQSDTKYFGHA